LHILSEITVNYLIALSFRKNQQDGVDSYAEGNVCCLRGWVGVAQGPIFWSLGII